MSSHLQFQWSCVAVYAVVTDPSARPAFVHTNLSNLTVLLAISSSALQDLQDGAWGRLVTTWSQSNGLPFPILGKYLVGFFQTVECSHFNNVALDRRIRYASTDVLFEEEFVLDCLVLFIDRSYRFPTFPPEGKESAVVWAESAYFVS